MSSESSLPELSRHSFSRNAYLILTMLIQGVAFGVFVYSLTVLQSHALDRWPFLVTEFFTVVIITFGHLTVAREMAWDMDLLDVLLPFLIGLLECLPMLLLGRVQNDAMWWFVCFLGLMNASFANLMNADEDTPDGQTAVSAEKDDSHSCSSLPFDVRHLRVLFRVACRTRRNTFHGGTNWDCRQPLFLGLEDPTQFHTVQ